MESQPYELRIDETPQGDAPFVAWLNALRDREARARIKKRLDRVILGNLGDYHSVGERVFEFRIDYGPGYRVYFAQRGRQIILLLCGGDKSTQEQDICGLTSNNAKMPTSRSYHDYLIESLKDPQEAAAYLETFVQEGETDLLHLALKNVAEAQIAITSDTQRVSNWEVIYQKLYKSSNLEFSTLLKMLNELGFNLSVIPKNFIG